MNVSLLHFLRTGRFGELQVGLTSQEVVALLGEPQAKGGTSRRYRHPCIYKYGCLEVWFSRKTPFEVVGIFIERDFERTKFEFWPSITVEDWELRPGAAWDEVKAYLVSHGIRFSEMANPDRFMLEPDEPGGRVHLGFEDEEEEGLHSLHSG